MTVRMHIWAHRRGIDCRVLIENADGTAGKELGADTFFSRDQAEQWGLARIERYRAQVGGSVRVRKFVDGEEQKS